MPDDRMPSGLNAQILGPIAAFGALVLGDETLQARLGEIGQSDVFVAEALALADAHGIALDDATVRAAIQPDPLGIGRWMPSPVTLDHWPSRGWLPARSVPTGGAPAFDWAWFGANRLDDPFYEGAVRRFAARPLSSMFRTRTSIDALAGVDAARGPAPAGFIHHMSRCGSTLVARMLAADPSHVVLSEPEPLDAALRWAIESGASRDDQIAALRAIVAALGRDRSGETRRVFFKLDSWHSMALPLFRAAFPETPWVFVYRNPVEVLVSQARERGIHTMAGMLPPHIFDIADAEEMEEDEYAARVLKLASEAVLDHWSLGGGLLVDYTEMPGAIIDRIAPHFGYLPDTAQRTAMTALSARSAKAPNRPFVPDAAAKREAATAGMQHAAREIVGPVYDRLELLRHRIAAA